MKAETQVAISQSNTSAAHRQAVERVILEMRERLSEPHSLLEMAGIACLSPFHFDRVFHEVTGIPAVQFLYALRIEAAKRLLLTTSLSVTDVCYEVGYNSIGTFTSRFTQLVGASPRQFRRLAEKVENSRLESSFDEVAAILNKTSPCPSVTGRIITPEGGERLIFVGLFPTSIPQSRPVGGTLLNEAGAYGIHFVPDGQYYVFVAAFPRVGDPLSYFLPDAESLLVGVGQSQAIVRVRRSGYSVDVMLRSLEIKDPPILIALPFLLADLRKSLTNAAEFGRLPERPVGLGGN